MYRRYEKPPTITSSQVPYYMGYIAEKCRRFFHAAAIEEMLETFLPLMNGTSLDVGQLQVTTGIPPLMTHAEYVSNSILFSDISAPLPSSILPSIDVSNVG